MPTGATPAVSVLMLAHNAGRFLAPAVESVLAPEYADLELVVVDNASTDDAVDRLQAAVRDPRLRLFREPRNLGIPSGTNRAFREARGRWIAVMDHDDRMRPEKLARQVAWLEAHPDAGGVAARTLLIDRDGHAQGGDFTLHDPAEHRAFTAYSQAANLGSHLFRREALEAFPRREEFPFSSDFDFVSRVAERWPVAALPEILFEYRVHPGQATSVHRPEQLAAEGAIRLLAAHRRAGRPEPIARAAGWVAELGAARIAADIHAACARIALKERFPVLAAYQARRLVGASPGLRSLIRGLALLRRARRLDPATAGLCSRLFFTGPLRTHGLKPWPRSGA